MLILSNGFMKSYYYQLHCTKNKSEVVLTCPDCGSKIQPNGSMDRRINKVSNNKGFYDCSPDRIIDWEISCSSCKHCEVFETDEHGLVSWRKTNPFLEKIK